jgi:large subunit ribosomal protein L4
MPRKRNKPRADRKKMKKQRKSKADNSKKGLDCPVRDMKGKKVDTVSLNNKVFDGVINVSLLHQIITMYRANQRSGSASTKTKAQVRGGGKKPWRQKGTGRARTGSIRNPLWRGGGIIFGPKPRDFSFNVPKEMRRGALRSSLNEKFLEDKLVVIDGIKLDEPKTKLFSSILNSLGVDREKKATVILNKLDVNTRLASRNVPNLTVKETKSVNALDVLSSHKLVIQLSSLKALMKVLQ